MKPTNDNGAHSFTEGATFETAENINEFLKEEKTMEAIRLISMTDIVSEQRMTTEEVRSSNFYDIQTHIYKYYDKVFNYANFLKQPLQLGFFVPCDENGNVLEEPTNYEKRLSNMMTEYNDEVYTYNQAKEKVLFEGFEYVKFINDGELLPYHRLIKNDEYFNVRFLDRNIEDLLTEFEYGIELTPTAIKQIGL